MLYMKKIGFYWWETTKENWDRLSELKKEYNNLLKQEKRNRERLSEIIKENYLIHQQMRCIK